MKNNKSNNRAPRPLIMVTNDDGIYSTGIYTAVCAAAEYGDVLVAAPAAQQTAMGRAYPRTTDLGIILETDLGLGSDVKSYLVHGSPGYCAAFGILELADRKPDLVISGINYGCNLGMSLTSSGTLGAAFEAYSQGIPVLALSLETPAEAIMKKELKEADFAYAKEITKFWIKKMLDQSGSGTIMESPYRFLNINIPSGHVDPGDYQMTFLEHQNYYVLKSPGKRDRSAPYTLEFEIDVNMDTLHEGSDICVVCRDRRTSVTPVTMDMTRNQYSRF